MGKWIIRFLRREIRTRAFLISSGRDDLDGRWKEVDLKTRELN